MTISDEFEIGPIKAFKYGTNIFGKPKMFVHQYFIDGLLIDAAHSRAKTHVSKRTKELNVKQLFVTHHHEDHSGNIKALQNQFSCKVLAGAKCAATMSKPPAISFAQWTTWGHRPAFNDFQVVDDLIETEKYRFELIPIPGHAHGMLALYERNEGWIFSADLYVYHYIKYFMRPESMRQQIKSIQNILKLDFEWMLCSHNPQTKNAKTQLNKKLQFFEDFFGQVATHRTKGLSSKQIFKVMKLKENWDIKILSHGGLSTMNMVKSALRDIEQFENE